MWSHGVVCIYIYIAYIYNQCIDVSASSILPFDSHKGPFIPSITYIDFQTFPNVFPFPMQYNISIHLRSLEYTYVYVFIYLYIILFYMYNIYIYTYDDIMSYHVISYHIVVHNG